MPEPTHPIKTLASALAKTALAVALYGCTVVIALLPQPTISWAGYGVIALSMVAVAITVAFGVRASPAPALVPAQVVLAQDDGLARSEQISRLEAAHALPAYQPDRSTRLGGSAGATLPERPFSGPVGSAAAGPEHRAENDYGLDCTSAG